MAPVLHDRTNSDSPTLPPNKTIRRVQSYRLSRFNIDSDGTYPSDLSEHSSIYDAPLAPPDRNANHEDEITSPLALQKNLAGLPLSPSLENLDQLANLPSNHTIQEQPTVSISHSNWPTVQLETITEQRSISTMHTSASLSRLNTRATRQLSIEAELPASDCPQRPSYWPPNWSAINRPSYRRSFSENDASCLGLPPRKAKRPIYKEYDLQSSSSTDELLTAKCLPACSTYPLKPTYPPPERSPTPPGLPKFGSQEAIELFAPPGSRATSARTTHGGTSGRNRISAVITQEDPPRPPRLVLQPVNPPSSMKSKSVIRRIISSLSGSSSEEHRQGQTRRISLPEGFVPQADDGTYVRGRWGARNSGHGVGTGARTSQRSMGLEGHPFHRLEPTGRTLAAEVREIEKACEARQRPLPQRSEHTTQRGVSCYAQSPSLHGSVTVPDAGEPSRSWPWQPFWPARVDAPHVFNTAQGAAVPSVIHLRADSQPENVAAERIHQSRTLVPRRLLQRRMSAESRILAVRLEEEKKRKRKQESCETHCWNWMCGGFCIKYGVEKEVAAIISRETLGNAPRSSRMLEVEDPGLPNARMVYPTPISEEEVLN